MRYVGPLKSALFVILLMLIATRLTWFQTSKQDPEVTASFYRSGLWFAEYLKTLCPAGTDATFPLPAEQTLRADFHAPAPAAGELSIGLIGMMLLKCQLGVLDAEGFINWNPWVFMAVALSVGLAARLFTSSWTAGLIAAAAVLSRGTIQSNAQLAASEPYAQVFWSCYWCGILLWFRSLSLVWLSASCIALFIAISFVPALWWAVIPMIVLFTGLALLQFMRGQAETPSNVVDQPVDSLNGKQFTHRFYVGIDQQDTSYRKLMHTCTPQKWLLTTFLFTLGTIMFTYAAHRFAPGSMEIASVYRALSRSIVVSSFLDFSAVAHNLAQAIATKINSADRHTWTTLAVIIAPLVFSSMAGPYRHFHRFISTFFLLSCGAVILATGFQEHLIMTAMNMNRPALGAAIRALEPLFIGWGIASLWSILNVHTGEHLQSAGWSIRGRDNIQTTTNESEH